MKELLNIIKKGMKVGCIFSDNTKGNCSLSSKDHPIQGCNTDEYDEEEEAYLCSVEGDPVPGDNCDSYESDSQCHQCGADYNAGEDCTCGEEE